MQDITITAPTSGQVTVTATAILDDLDDELAECQLTEVTANPNSHNRALWAGSGESAFEVMTQVRSFATGAGSTKTCDSRCRNLDGSSSNFRAGMMTATFTPDP